MMCDPDDHTRRAVAVDTRADLAPAPPAGSNGAVPARSTAAATGEETRARIVAAALDTVRNEGIAGVSARSIARTGDFNQALIFYHFGSVDRLLVAAAVADSDRRAALYADALEQVQTLPQLVGVARLLHDREFEQGSVTVLAQLLAGAAHSPELADGLNDGFTPWMELVEATVTRVLAGTPLEGIIPLDDIAFAIASLFLGMELITGLTPDDRRDETLLTTLELIGGMVELLMGAKVPGAAPVVKAVAKKAAKQAPSPPKRTRAPRRAAAAKPTS